MTPWSGTPTPPRRDDGSSSTTAPGGGPCAKTLAERPFAPSFSARTTQPERRRLHPRSSVDVGRSDGNQELKGVDVDLPPGLTRQAGRRPLLPARQRSPPRRPTAAPPRPPSPSCPDVEPGRQRVGRRRQRARTASSINGKAFLSGPYHGAPLSLAVITPATAGPFDLGSVVVRVALFVDPETARVHAVSDPIPHVFGGALLDIRSVVVTLNRPETSRSTRPTARRWTVGGTLRGGGANPLDPAAFSSHARLGTRSSVNGCDKLGFKPKLFMRVFGGTRRAKSPKLRAILVARERRRQHRPRRGDPAEGRCILEQASLANVCTRVQFAANDCPKDSIYGYASGEDAAARRAARKARSTCAPPTTNCRTWSPPCTVRSTSSSSAASTASKAALRTTFDVGPRRAGLEVHAHRERRQETGPAGQLDQPLRAQAPR